MEELHHQSGSHCTRYYHKIVQKQNKPGNDYIETCTDPQLCSRDEEQIWTGQCVQVHWGPRGRRS